MQNFFKYHKHSTIVITLYDIFVRIYELKDLFNFLASCKLIR